MLQRVPHLQLGVAPVEATAARLVVAAGVRVALAAVAAVAGRAVVLWLSAHVVPVTRCGPPARKALGPGAARKMQHGPRSPVQI